MAYARLPITRANPGCIVFVLDHSGSMSGQFGGDLGDSDKSQVRKSEGLAQVVNRFLQSLAVRCTRDEGIYDYFEIGVFGYGTRAGAFASLLSGPLMGRDLVPISTLADHPLRIEDRSVKVADSNQETKTVTQKMPVWVEPIAVGGTPMCAALHSVRQIVATWVSTHPDAFPPIVIHITDGGSTDGDPIRPAEELRALSTSDGNLLLFNCHISSTAAHSVLFPESPTGLTDPLAKMLFEMSSELPEAFLSGAQAAFPQLTAHSRGFAFNAGLIELIQFIDMGTRASTRLR